MILFDYFKKLSYLTGQDSRRIKYVKEIKQMIKLEEAILHKNLVSLCITA